MVESGGGVDSVGVWVGRLVARPGEGEWRVAVTESMDAHVAVGCLLI